MSKLLLYSSALVWAICCLPACKQEAPKRDVRAYYYPAEHLRAGRVYEYINTGLSEEPVSEYWYYRAFPRDSGLFLSATFYDQHFQIGQISREKIVATGALARECFLYEPDTITRQQAPVPVSIQSPNVFPFQVSDSTGVFLYKLQYHPIWEPEATVTLVRNRRFLGDGPMFKFNGKQYPSIRFDVREKISNDHDEESTVEAYGEEWYAYGIGLVYSRKTYGAGELTLENRLNSIFTMPELERRAKAVYDSE